MNMKKAKLQAVPARAMACTGSGGHLNSLLASCGRSLQVKQCFLELLQAVIRLLTRSVSRDLFLPPRPRFQRAKEGLVW